MKTTKLKLVKKTEIIGTVHYALYYDERLVDAFHDEAEARAVFDKCKANEALGFPKSEILEEFPNEH